MGQPVEALRLQDLDAEAEYDGVWACASLLHVPEREMRDALARVVRALRPSGMWYLSFKEGTGESERDGRRFTSYTEHALGE